MERQITTANLNAAFLRRVPQHWLASAAFRSWCFRRSTAIHDGAGRLGPLRRILADVPCYLLEFTR